MKTIKSILLLACAVYSIYGSMQIASIWEGRAHPLNAIVVLENNKIESGSVVPLWNGKWEIQKSNGEIIQFDDYRAMGYKADARSLLERWRFILPVFLTFGVVAFFTLRSCFKDFPISNQTQ